MKNVTILLVVLAMVAASANAATVVWKDQGVALNSWHTPGNWVGDAVPQTGDTVHLYGLTGGTAEFSTGTLSVDRIVVGQYGINDDVHLLISGGSLTTTASARRYRNRRHQETRLDGQHPHADRRDNQLERHVVDLVHP